MRRIGLFGGTFDPVHYGHLRSALELREALGLHEVRFIPCHHPPHRDTPAASADQRLHMLKLALSGADFCVIDERELAIERPSYTVETLMALRQEFPQAPFYWFMGMDAFAGFNTWHRWTEILELTHLVVTPRPGSGQVLPAELEALLKDRHAPIGQATEGVMFQAGSIFIQTVTQLDISATHIRRLVASNHSLRYLLPEPVRQYIEEENLYL